MRALEEQSVLARRIVERARRANQAHAAKLFEKRAEEAETHGSMIRELLLSAEKGEIAEPAMRIGKD